MNWYGPTPLAASSRIVCENTLVIAEETPEEHHGYRPAEGFRTVSELLTHIAFQIHHRGQLKLIKRMLGITPRLARQNKARFAAIQARTAAALAKA